MADNGYIAYNGPSQLDGAPIKAIVTGTKRPSDNPKTGDMLQLWIMPVNSKPSDAVKNDDDASVCGLCPHRPTLAKQNNVAPCYVQTYQHNSIYKADYPGSALSRNVPIRLGAWGDPAALPFETVAPLVGNGHTGYTHQWRTCDPRFKTLLMASVDNDAEAVQAQSMGWRTFRVKTAGESLRDNEIACPASKESGKRTTCADCRLCAGTSKNAKNIAIVAH
jgi:hypothetical protein